MNQPVEAKRIRIDVPKLITGLIAVLAGIYLAVWGVKQSFEAVRIEPYLQCGYMEECPTLEACTKDPSIAYCNETHCGDSACPWVREQDTEEDEQ